MQLQNEGQGQHRKPLQKIHSAKMNIRLKSVEKFIKYNVIYSKSLKFVRFDSSLRPCNNFILRWAIAVGLCKVHYQIKVSKIFFEIYKENDYDQKNYFMNGIIWVSLVV